jgi:hypothetical protein
MMKRKGRIVIVGAALAAAALLAAGPAVSEDKPADNMQILKEKMTADRKLFVAEVMGLTESEAKSFWPVYDAYQKAMDKLADRSLKLIQDYARDYETMSDQTAKKLLDDYMGIENDRQKLRQSYLPKFRKALPDKKVTRYYQLENKISALVTYEVARLIPLVE